MDPPPEKGTSDCRDKVGKKGMTALKSKVSEKMQSAGQESASSVVECYTRNLRRLKAKRKTEQEVGTVDSTSEISAGESDMESRVRRFEKVSKSKHSNPHRLPKSVAPGKTAVSEQVLFSNAQSAGKNFEEYSKAIAMRGETLGPALREGLAESGCGAVNLQ